MVMGSPPPGISPDSRVIGSMIRMPSIGPHEESCWAALMAAASKFRAPVRARRGAASLDLGVALADVLADSQPFELLDEVRERLADADAVRRLGDHAHGFCPSLDELGIFGDIVESLHPHLMERVGGVGRQ